MLLAIDIGNSNIVWGLFDRRTLKGHWRLATDPRKTSDEYGILFSNLLATVGVKPEQISGAVISSVVPILTRPFETMAQTFFGQVPLVISCDTDTGLTLRYANPKEIGSDRLVNAAAAYERYRADLIIVDFGTATTFCAVTKAGEYLGGVIAPGLGISADALFSRTAQLPKVELVRPKSVIGRDTASSIQSGLVYGYAGLLHGSFFPGGRDRRTVHDHRSRISNDSRSASPADLGWPRTALPAKSRRRLKSLLRTRTTLAFFTHTGRSPTKQIS